MSCTQIFRAGNHLPVLLIFVCKSASVLFCLGSNRCSNFVVVANSVNQRVVANTALIVLSDQLHCLIVRDDVAPAFHRVGTPYGELGGYLIGCRVYRVLMIGAGPAANLRTFKSERFCPLQDTSSFT